MAFSEKVVSTREPENKVVGLGEYPKAWKEIKPLTIDEMIASKPSPKEYILYPWLPKQGLALIHAAAGTGKTFFTLNVAYAIAGGGNFLKFKAPKPKKILYVDGEMSYIDIYNRVMDMIRQQGDIDFRNNWLIYNPEKSNNIVPKICTPEGQSFYNDKIKEYGIDVLILDNLATLSLIDTSNTKEWAIIQNWFIHLRSQGTSVILIHHEGKNGTYRGTSNMTDCMNTVIRLSELVDMSSENEITNSLRMKIEYKKSRDFGGKDALSFEANFCSDRWGIESLEIAEFDRVIQMYRDFNEKQCDIARDLNLPKWKVCRYIQRAIKKGLVIK